jgi:hypothetical protein
MVLLEDAVVNFDKSFTTWKPEVEASLSTVKLELSKFNSFFTHEGKMLDTSSPGIVSSGTTSSHPVLGSVATGPQGHRVDSSHRDCGYWGVYTHIHDPVKGTFYTPPPPLENPKPTDTANLASGRAVSSHNTMGLGAKHLLGKLPKINFPKFEVKNPRLWKSRVILICIMWMSTFGSR